MPKEFVCNIEELRISKLSASWVSRLFTLDKNPPVYISAIHVTKIHKIQFELVNNAP